MSIIITAGSSGPKSDPVPAGTHSAVCYGVVDLGTQESEQYGPKAKIALLWEIPDERIEVKGKSLPRGISKRYTASLNEKANLRKDLEAWRGRQFTAAELAGFDLANILGKSCLLNVIHQDTPRGTFSGVAGVMPLPKGMPPKAPENGITHFSIKDAVEAAKAAGQRDVQWPGNLPQWLLDVCSKSQEYQALVTGKAPSKNDPVAPLPPLEDLKEDVPF